MAFIEVFEYWILNDRLVGKGGLLLVLLILIKLNELYILKYNHSNLENFTYNLKYIKVL